MIKEEVKRVVNLTLNTPVWQAKKGTGSFLTFDLGERVIRQRKNGTPYETGSIHLWIYLCDWKVVAKSSVIAQSDSNEDDITKAMQYINGRQIVSLECLNLNTIEIKFSDEISIILTGNDSVYEKDDDFFILYTNNGNVSYNKDSGFTLEVA